MSESKDRPRRMQTRGGYTGSKPASEMGPPPKTPSASVSQDAKRKHPGK